MKQTVLDVMPEKMRIEFVRLCRLSAIVAEVSFKDGMAIFAGHQLIVILYGLKLQFFCYFSGFCDKNLVPIAFLLM